MEKQYGGSSKKLKIELPYDPAIPHLGIYLKKIKTLVQKDIYTSMFTATLFTIAKIWKQPNCPLVHEWIKKIQNIYIYVCVCIHIYAERDRIYISHKNKILPFATIWMDLEGIMLSEI